MSYDRRPDRRSGGGRPPGGRPQGPRSDRPPRDREGFGGPPRDRAGGFGQRPPGRGGFERSGDRPGGGFQSRGRDDGGMSIRLDPRRLAALKLLAAEAGLRPGELVTQWVEERLDAARSGEQPAPPRGGGKELADLSARIDELSRRVDALSASGASSAEVAETSGASAEAAPTEEPAPAVESAPPAPKRRGRPPKSPTEAVAPRAPRVPLHEEIEAVIAERGPMSAGDLATAIKERGRYSAPRSAKPLDSTTVNARVSNPIYRSRFTRNSGRIGLANDG